MIRLSNVINHAHSYSLSPDSKLVAVSIGSSVRVLEVKNMTKVQDFAFDEDLQLVKFSEDS